MESKPELTIEEKYHKVVEWRKRSCTNWRQKNREKHNEITRNYYNKRKDEPEYMEHKRAKARASYKRRKEAKTKQEEENGKEEAPAINISLYSTDTDV